MTGRGATLAGDRPGMWAAWRITRGLLAAGALAGVLAGVPWALLQHTHWPITGVPTWEQIVDFPAAAAQDSTIVAAFTLGLWLAWAVFAACVVVEVIGEVRGTDPARVPAAGPLQRLARTLVASIAMTIGSLGTLSLPDSPGAGRPLPTSATATVALPAPLVDDTTQVDAAASTQASGGEEATAWRTITVDHGDSAWDLAERCYGDGTAWLRLWEDNRHHLQPDGRTWANRADPVEPGWQLRIRTSQPAPAANAVPGEQHRRASTGRASTTDAPPSGGHADPGKQHRGTSTATTGTTDHQRPDSHPGEQHGGTSTATTGTTDGHHPDREAGGHDATDQRTGRPRTPVGDRVVHGDVPDVVPGSDPGGSRQTVGAGAQGWAGVRTSPPTPPSVSAEPSSPHTPSPDAGEIVVTVQPGDHFWRLGEGRLATTLGRQPTPAEIAPYWRQVIDANRDRLVQPGNPDLIHPGQQLRLPSVPAVGPPATPPSPTPGETPQPQPTETHDPDGHPTPIDQPAQPPDLTGQTPPAQPDVAEPPEPATDPATDGRPSNESQQPVETTSMPSAGGPPDAPDGQPAEPTPNGTRQRGPEANGPDPASSPTSSTRDDQQPSTSSPPTDDSNGDGDSELSPAPVIGALAAGVALAIGVTRAVRRRRRRRNHRSPTTTPRPSSHPQVHRELIDAADEDAYEQLRLALHDLATTVAGMGAECRPRIVQHGTGYVDVLLDTPTEPATGGWRAQGDGAIWSLDQLPDTSAAGTGADEVDSGFDGPAATPLLVTLGQPDDGGQLYIDLEAEGVVSLTGDPDVVHGVARAFVTELAHSPLAGATQVIVVGDLATQAIAQLDRVTVAASWSDVADNVHAWAEQSHDALVHNHWPHAFAARAQDADHDALVSLVVVTDQLPDDPETLTRLLALEPRAGALVVAGHDIAGSTTIECAPDRLTLPQLDLACRPQPLDTDQLEAITDLLDDAEDPTGEQLQLLPDTPDTWVDATDDLNDSGDPASEPFQLLPDLPIPWPHAPEHHPDVTDDLDDTNHDSSSDATAGGGNGGPYRDPPYDVLVRVLGDITVEGATRPLTPKQTAVLAYIALHRTASAERMGDALWPDAAPSWRRRLANTVSACRTAIGGNHLPLADDGTYRAGPRLLTDTELFTRRLAAAAHQPRHQAIETLHGALDLVRGPIFQYPDSQRTPYFWVSLENWISIWEQKITAVACQVTDAYLTTGHTRQAVDVAQHAQSLNPTDTTLTELLMRAHAANGDHAAVRRVYHAHIDALAHLDIDDPADSTATLYDQLRATTPT